jgi:hypothetical protein
MVITYAVYFVTDIYSVCLGINGAKTKQNIFMPVKKFLLKSLIKAKLNYKEKNKK